MTACSLKTTLSKNTEGTLISRHMQVFWQMHRKVWGYTVKSPQSMLKICKDTELVCSYTPELPRLRATTIIKTSRNARVVSYLVSDFKLTVWVEYSPHGEQS